MAKSRAGVTRCFHLLPMLATFLVALALVTTPALAKITTATGTSPSSTSSSSSTTTTTTTTSSSSSLSNWNALDAIGATVDPTKTFAKATHPEAPVYLDSSISPPIPTNEFWTPFIVRPGSNWVYVNPFVVQVNFASPYGLVATHSNDRSSDYFNSSFSEPQGNTNRMDAYWTQKAIDIGFSAYEGLSSHRVTGFDEFSCQLLFQTSGATGTDRSVNFPLVKGMAYVTAEYNGLTPLLYSEKTISSLSTTDNLKWTITLSDGVTWLLYSLDTPITMQQNGANQIISKSGALTGTLRIAKIPNNANFPICFYEMWRKTNQSYMIDTYDHHRWRYPVGGHLNVTVLGEGLAGAFYYFTWTIKSTGVMSDTTETFTYTNGTSMNVTIPLLHFGFPHHQDSIVNDTTPLFRLTKLAMMSPSKGMMQAFVGDKWTMREGDTSTIAFNMPSPMQNDAYSGVVTALVTDLAQDFTTATYNNTDLVSLGRQLQKYAMLCQAASGVGLPTLSCYTKLTAIMKPFITQTSTSVNADLAVSKLVYDTVWGGLVSTADIAGTSIASDGTGGAVLKAPLSDGGSTYYQNHQFQYGPFIYAAALLAYNVQNWGTTYGSIVEMLIRDVANPTADSYFPMFRAYDWFHGHCWGYGVDPTYPNRDYGNHLTAITEEINFHHAVRLWGLANQNKNSIRDLGMAMFALSRRVARRYILIMKEQSTCPYDFRDNKAVGTLQDGMVQFWSYNSNLTEAIHGQHMKPLVPIMQDVRYPDYVMEEWMLRLKDYAPLLNNTWKSVLYSNLAIVNASSAFSALEQVQPYEIDDWYTQSWLLYWTATRPESTQVNVPNIFGPWGNSTCPEPLFKASWTELWMVLGTCIIAGSFLVFAFCVTPREDK